MKTEQKVLIKGNNAIAEAALRAGCEAYFGYPITPQSEIGEYLSDKMPAYVCAESELAAINMVIGACSTGAKAMTSSSSCAVALMQEAISFAAGDELPVVLVSVMRGGPGLGYIYPAQGDYNQALIGGGNGDYKCIVLAPSNVQECVDLTYKAFYLAQKWRNPVILLADGLLGQMMEPVKFDEYPYEEIDNSDWALTGAKGRARRAIYTLELDMDVQARHVEHLFEKYSKIEQTEQQWEEFMCEDADIIVTCFGSVARNVCSAVKQCREQGIKAGMFRPISLFPFPNARLAELSPKMFLDIEVNMGQMLRDVRLAVNGRAPVEFFGKPVGAPQSVEDIVEEIKKWAL